MFSFRHFSSIVYHSCPIGFCLFFGDGKVMLRLRAGLIKSIRADKKAAKLSQGDFVYFARFGSERICKCTTRKLRWVLATNGRWPPPLHSCSHGYQETRERSFSCLNADT